MSVSEFLAIVILFHAVIGWFGRRMVYEPDDEWAKRGNPRSYR